VSPRISLERLRAIVSRNRPSQKPQLWEDLPLAIRRRVRFEIGRRADLAWLDRAQVIALSEVGSPDQLPPLRIEVCPREMMNQALFLYGTFEISETRLIQSMLRSGMTFIDVGANIGYYTLVAARLVGETGLVHCFEPNDPMRVKLEANIRRNGFGNVVVHADAVARETGEVAFYASTWDANQGTSSILPGNGRGAMQKVRSVSLDDFVMTLAGRRVDLIKMDIEGAELIAIEGGRRALGAADAPPVIFEAADLAPVAAALRALGYKIRRLHYTLENGLELPDAEAPLRSLFEDYEAPNYFAAKDEGVFGDVVARANAKRSPALRLLGLL
jgi:FkbM family methyltransferase